MSKRKLNKDVVLKEFWRDNARFAALFNGMLFQGREVLRAEQLEEMDTDLSGVIGTRGREVSLERWRDVVKKAAFGMEFAVVGIENQEAVHYAMPLRVMIYDAMGYLKEYKDLSRSYEKGELTTSSEFLSGMKREDRLHPIITIVIYYGEEAWDGPLSLMDMLEPVSEDIREVIADYPMNLLQVCNSENYRFNNEDVQTVLEVSREIQAGQFEKLKEQYSHKKIRGELLRVIGAVTSSKELMEQAEDEQEVFDMCRSLELLKEQGKEEGLKQGKEEGLKQGKEEGIHLGVQRGEQQERKRGLVNAISLVVDMGHDLSVAVSRSAKKYQMSEAEVWSIWNASQE